MNTKTENKMIQGGWVNVYAVEGENGVIIGRINRTKEDADERVKRNKTKRIACIHIAAFIEGDGL
jgi:hypothetical protein